MYKSAPAVNICQTTTLSPWLLGKNDKKTDTEKINKVKNMVKGNLEALDLYLSSLIQMENKASDCIPAMMNYKVGLFLMSKLQEG